MADVAVSPPKFKVGDRVRCVTLKDPYYEDLCCFGDYILVGHKYTVSKNVEFDEGSHRVKLINGSFYTPSEHMFQLVSSKPFVKSEWM